MTERAAALVLAIFELIHDYDEGKIDMERLFDLCERITEKAMSIVETKAFRDGASSNL